MLKTLMSATAIGGLMVSAALAQAPATQQPAQPAQPPAATQPAKPAPMGAQERTQTQERMKTEDRAQTPAPKDNAAAPAAAGHQFIAAQMQDQFLSSRFRGTDVIGPNNEQVGDVNDVLFDSDGKVVGIVVGVGGFLGIGQKDVAIDLAAFEIVPADVDRNATTGTAAPAPAPKADGMKGDGMKGAVMNDPNNIKLRVSWTKEQLEKAPSFERFRVRTTTTGGATKR